MNTQDAQIAGRLGQIKDTLPFRALPGEETSAHALRFLNHVLGAEMFLTQQHRNLLDHYIGGSRRDLHTRRSRVRDHRNHGRFYRAFHASPQRVNGSLIRLSRLYLDNCLRVFNHEF